jgi:hypothetical protein
MGHQRTFGGVRFAPESGHDGRQLGRQLWAKRQIVTVDDLAQTNEIPSRSSLRQITRHSRLERAESKESAKVAGTRAGYVNDKQEPTFVRLSTVQSTRDELVFKIIFALFNTRVRAISRRSCMARSKLPDPTLGVGCYVFAKMIAIYWE